MVTSVARFAALGAALVLAGVAHAHAAQAAAPPLTAEGALAKYDAAWAPVRTYACTITAREVQGSRVQDRVYHIFFQKPHDTRMEIVGGDGRGGAAVWRGGDKVYGHQGGLLRFFRLHLNIHDSRATSIRGTTIADANFGAVVDYIRRSKTASRMAESVAGKTKLTFVIAGPIGENGVTKQVLVLDGGNLPLEFWEYVGDQVVKRIIYSDVRLNVDLPPSTWEI